MSFASGFGSRSTGQWFAARTTARCRRIRPRCVPCQMHNASASGRSTVAATGSCNPKLCYFELIADGIGMLSFQRESMMAGTCIGGLIAMPLLATCQPQAPSALRGAPAAVLQGDKGTPNRAQPCGPSICLLDVSLILRYRVDMESFLLWAAMQKRQRECPAHRASEPCSLHRGMSCISNCVPSSRRPTVIALPELEV